MRKASLGYQPFALLWEQFVDPVLSIFKMFISSYIVSQCFVWLGCPLVLTSLSQSPDVVAQGLSPCDVWSFL